jgi:hypothetical protein
MTALSSSSALGRGNDSATNDFSQAANSMDSDFVFMPQASAGVNGARVTYTATRSKRG